MSLSKEQQEFSIDIAKLIIKANILGIRLTFGDAYRSKEQQEIYFKAKKSKTMKSNHLRRLAVDFNFFIDGKLIYINPLLEKLGHYWESLNKKNRWGGHFSNFYDAPHFERNV
jgi:peptidoglycan L-alanyl-D-glutamate endopeptidase CwlK